MSFAYPEFLFALAAVSVPIIIHLFNFRRFKTVYFSDIRFLKNVEIQTKSRNQLKNLLILLSRILAIAFLVLAFARPILPTGDNSHSESANSVVVYIDNSFSMNADGETGSLLDQAKTKAIEIGSAYANATDLHLLTNDFNPQHFRNLSFEEFKNEVTSVQPSPQVRTFNNIVSRASSVFNSQEPSRLFFLSDLQTTSSSPKQNITDSLLDIYVVPIQAIVLNNIYVDSAWFSTPSRLPLQPDMVHARIRNTGSSDVKNLSVKLNINGVQRSVGTTNVASQSYEDVELAFTNAESGFQLAEISIQDYPITYDDKYYLSFDLTNQISIVSVNGDQLAPTYATRIFESEDNFSVVQVSDGALDYSILASTDLLICNEVSSFSSGMTQELMKFVVNGGSLLILPSSKADLSSTNELLLAVGAEKIQRLDSSKVKVEGVNLKSAVFKNVFTEWEDRIDLPSISKYFVTSSGNTVSSERLLTLANGQPLLTAYKKGKGHCYVLTTVLRDEWTNFHRHALFVPALYNIALNSVTNGVSKEVIGSNEMIAVNSKIQNSELLEVSNTTANSSFVPEKIFRSTGNGILVHNQVQNAGHFLLKTNNGDSIQPLSFNFNREESNLAFLLPSEFQKQANAVGITNINIIETTTEDLAGTIQEIHNGKQLWRLFLLLALLCLLFETVLIRIL